MAEAKPKKNITIPRELFIRIRAALRAVHHEANDGSEEHCLHADVRREVTAAVVALDDFQDARVAG